MKKGITAASISIMIVIIIILLGTVTISSYNSIQNAKRTTFSLEISSIQEEVDKYMRLNNSSEDYPILTNVYTLSLENVSEDIISTQFKDESINSNKEITLYEIDLEAIDMTNTQYGKMKTDKDVYVLSKETGKVYYLNGIKANKTTYYTLTNDLIELDGRNEKKQEEILQTKPNIQSDNTFTIKQITDSEKEIYLSNISLVGENIKIFKYELGNIPEGIAKQYFQNSGKTIIGDRIKLEKEISLTLYAENEKGDYTVKYIQHEQ